MSSGGEGNACRVLTTGKTGTGGATLMLKDERLFNVTTTTTITAQVC